MADIRVDIQQATLVQDVANTTQNISLTAGFGTPKAVMIVRTGFQPGATGFWGNNNFSIGVYDGTNEFCISGMIDGQGTPFNIIDATSSHSNITIGRHIQVGPFQVPEEAFTLESWGEDLVTIKTTVATNDVGDLPWKITVIAFGGSSLLNASVVEKDDLRTGTDQININVGHKTSAAFFLSANTSTPLADFDDVTKAGEEILKASFGIALNKSGTPQRCMAWGAVDDSDPTDYTMYLANDAVMASVLSGSLNYKVSVTEWTDTKIGVTPSASASNAILGLLCLEYDDDTDFNLIDIAFPASGDYSETGIGFTSTLGMLCSASGVSSRNTATSADGAVNICAFNSTDIWSSNWSCESGITADPFTAHSGYHLKLLIADPTPASNPTAVVESSDNTITSTGWDFTLSTTSAVLGFAFALGERVAPLEKDVTKSAYSHTYTDGTTKIHAGSKMQIGHNLGKVFYYDDTQAFINMVKGGKLRTNTTLNSPDANGYIDSTGGGDWDHTLHTGEFLLPGKYVCRWTGTCTVTLRTTSGSDITPDPPDTTPNRHEYTLTATDGGLYLRMESGTCTNLEFLGPGLAEETNYDNGNILTTTFKNDLAGITCIRCMDWLQINDAPIRNVADMSDYNYIVWINDEAGYPDIVGGVPFRVIAEAAEELDVDLWVNTHHQMVDAAVTAAANEVWNNLSAGWKASHRIYVEYSNELWNSSFHDAWSWIRHLGGGPLVDATMTPSTGSVSSTTHGLTTGDRIVCHWNTTHDDSPYSRGFEIRVVRDDANTFRVTYRDLLA